MLSFENTLKARRVLITGHTGFKGGWLALWLADLGAEVHGLSLAPQTTPNLFDSLNLHSLVQHHVGDIRERDAVVDLVKKIAPEIVFHLAAQPLVRRSFDEPLYTIETNVLGTSYVLEGCRQTEATKAIICVTTDKVYDNREWVWPYRETDALGGKDPYSASKAAAEIIAASYSQSLMLESGGPALATARGGNVIGGGDWSEDRLVPDLVRAITSDQSLTIRNPSSTRPWQHVLALCHGYLQLASGLLMTPEKNSGAWNFGPDSDGTVSVRDLLQHFERVWKLPKIVEGSEAGKPESRMLSLDSAKARQILGWTPPWSLEVAVAQTAKWYQMYYAKPEDAVTLTREQIGNYRAALAKTSPSV